MLLQMKLKAGQTRCCEKRTGENSVSSETSFLGWLVNVLISTSVLFSSSTHRPFLSKCKLLFSVFFFFWCASSPESSPAAEPPSKRVKIEETFQLSEQQKQLIREDTANKKLWDEAMGNLKEGPVRISVHSDSNTFQSPRCCVFTKHLTQHKCINYESAQTWM